MSKSKQQTEADETRDLVMKCIQPLQKNVLEHGSPLLVKKTQYEYIWEYDDGYTEFINIASV